MTASVFDRALMSFEHGAHLLFIDQGRVYGHVPTGFAKVDRAAWWGHELVALLARPTKSAAHWQKLVIAQCADQRFSPFITLEMPIPAADLAWMDDGNIVICGEAASGARAYVLDPFPKDHVHRWNALPIPAELAHSRKGFDALAVRGSQCVAIDNFVLPKWLVRYTATHNGPMQLEQTAEMPSNGAYEHVRSASSGRTCFAVLSTTMNAFLGGRAFLTLYRHADLTPLGSLQAASARVQYAMQGDDLLVLDSANPGELRRYRGELDSGDDAALRMRVTSDTEDFTFPTTRALTELSLTQTVRFTSPFDRLCRSNCGSIVLGTSAPEGPFEVLRE